VRYGHRGQHIAEFACAPGEMLQVSLAPLARICGRRLSVERLAILPQVIDDAGDLRRGGHRGLLRSESGPHGAAGGAEGGARRATACAACRKAWVARRTTFSVRERHTLPPETSWCGASPSHEQQCFTVGHWLMSVPTSERRVWAMAAEIPVTATRSPR
jgi:hypothetical protein